MTMSEHKHHDRHMHRQGGGGGAVYGIGLFGAWVYYFKRAGTSQERIMAFCKGLFWPAFLVHDLLVFLEKAAPAQPAKANQE